MRDLYFGVTKFNTIVKFFVTIAPHLTFLVFPVNLLPPNAESLSAKVRQPGKRSEAKLNT